MKRALALVFALFAVTGCSTSSDEPGYISKAGKGTATSQKTSDDYFNGVAYCEKRQITVENVKCNVNYRHAFTKQGRGLYTAEVTVLEGCNGRSAAEISAETKRIGGYRLDCTAYPSAFMTLLRTNETVAVDIKYLGQAFTVKPVAVSTAPARFNRCP